MAYHKLLSLVMILLLVSCTFVESLNSSSSAPRSSWISELLENPPCLPPCWENIVPGETTIQEAKEILLAKGSIKAIYSSKDVFEWVFVPSDEHGKVEADNDSELVSFISLGPIVAQSLELNDILDIYSEPSYIDFYPNTHNTRSCYLSIIFESIGLIIANGNVPCKTWEQDGTYDWKINIQGDFKIERIIFETPERVIAIEKSGEIALWKGYGEYSRVYKPK